jgi:hypothetical protein
VLAFATVFSDHLQLRDVGHCAGKAAIPASEFSVPKQPDDAKVSLDFLNK